MAATVATKLLPRCTAREAFGSAAGTVVSQGSDRRLVAVFDESPMSTGHISGCTYLYMQIPFPLRAVARGPHYSRLPRIRHPT